MFIMWLKRILLLSTDNITIGLVILRQISFKCFIVLSLMWNAFHNGTFVFVYSSFNITNKFSEGKHFNLPQNNYISILSGYDKKKISYLMKDKKQKQCRQNYYNVKIGDINCTITNVSGQ